MKTIEELKAMIQAGEEAKRELESRGKVKFRNPEIVVVGPAERLNWFRNLDRYDRLSARKLTLEELVLSMAPPEAVRWDMVGSVHVLFCSATGIKFDHMFLPDHMARDDWEGVGGEL
jgi:hypothetical protein